MGIKKVFILAIVCCLGMTSASAYAARAGGSGRTVPRAGLIIDSNADSILTMWDGGTSPTKAVFESYEEISDNDGVYCSSYYIDGSGFHCTFGTPSSTAIGGVGASYGAGGFVDSVNHHVYFIWDCTVGSTEAVCESYDDNAHVENQGSDYFDECTLEGDGFYHCEFTSGTN